MYKPVPREIASQRFSSVEDAARAVGGDMAEMEVSGMKKTCRNPFTGEVCCTWSSPGAWTYFVNGDETRRADVNEINSASAYSIPTCTGYKTIEPWFDLSTGKQIGWKVDG